MGDSTRSSPITFGGGGVLAGDDTSSAPEPTAQIGSASGSYQNEGLLGGGEGGGVSGGDAEFGFQRPEFGRETLAGTVQFYERHVFLCYKTPQVWPSHLEAAESDRLPRLFSAALAARKGDMKKKTRLTLCEGEDGTESSNGDVLIFPDMIRYRRLTHFDVNNFVEEVLVKDTEWPPGAAETITGSFVFVCAHGSRDRRCGVCGPVLIKRFKEEINLRGCLQGQVSVSPCSHVGGHKYAGNVVIFSPNKDGEVTGHWYGYVAPDDVPALLEQHIGKGEIVDNLWRGQMGLSEQEQKKALELLRHHVNGAIEQSTKGPVEAAATEALSASDTVSGGCCGGTGSSTCCPNGTLKEKPEKSSLDEKPVEKENAEKESSSGMSKAKGPSTRKICPMPTWYETWEREDTYAALAVVAAIASVVVAYSFYKQLR
uniref:Altered inheritance of mitochondria protein 32 n=1 Tax=Ananas comosus var. bracteatus TaxID=296719 RepID=A0A6V7QRN8_ANACO